MSRRPRFLLVLASLLATLFALPLQAQPREIPGELLVKYKPSVRTAQRAALRVEMTARPLGYFGFVNVDHVKVEGMSVADAIARFRNDPRVEYVEPNYEWSIDVVPNDPRFPELYGMQNTGQTGGTPGADISATQAWNIFTGDPNLKIGVIDTGVDYNHPDLAANAWTNPGEIPGNNIDDDGNGYVDDIHGYDFVNNDGDPMDDNGHGSHCAGTIAAVGNNAVGVVGVNWQAKIIGIKFLSAGGTGSTAAAISSVQYAIAVGARLTSNSWGGGPFSQALLDAINAAGAAGQLFIAAAGNSGQDTDITPHYPSSYTSPYIISVANSNNMDNLSSTSNWGATSVDLSAPGSAILSLAPGGGYATLSGTSMACPHVAGVAALTWGRFPALTPAQVKNLILSSVDVKPQLTGRVLSNGRLNAFLTIADPDSTPPGAITDLSTSSPSSNAMVLNWTATGDDGSTGRASSYVIAYSTSPINAGNFDAASQVVGPDPLPAGGAESFEVGGLDFNTTYYFAIKARDEFQNAGPISNVPTGTTLGIPDIAASPGSFTSNLLTGASDTQTLQLSNTADGTLDFTIPTPQLMFSQPMIYEYMSHPKGSDWRIGDPVVNNVGGPDAFGYRWIDSNEAGGPTFSWVDITGVGTLQPLTGDDAISGAIPMGMDFPFYGNTFNSVRIATNGFLSFTDVATSFENQGLPSAGAPANLIAPFWDDLDFGTVQRVYTHFDGTRFIVTWNAVPAYQTGGPYTFQAILYPSGEIRYQYQALGSPTNSATAGIQNAAKDVGLTVVFNAPYLANGLAVRIVPLRQWLSVSPTSGRIAAGQSMNLDVQISALGLNGGTYNGTVRVESNDPDENPTDLPVTLNVTGAPDIAVSPLSLAYGTQFVGATPSQNVTVSNPGTDQLTISGITSPDGSVGASPPSFALAAGGVQVVAVTWSPTAVGPLNSTLDIASDDPDQPLVQVALTGNAVPAPVFSVDPESLAVALATNTATSRTLRITNSGGSPYDFTAEAQETSGATVTVYGESDNVFVDKGQNDTQAGIAPLASGGPDAFGYTFRDSNEPGGPVFNWVDISALGTPFTMATFDDANSGAVPIGFDFPYYGTTFNTIRACTNGWLSFTSAATSFSNLALPNTATGAPENLLAVFWDDLHFRSVQRARYYNDGSRFIVQYTGVDRFTTGSNLTFQVILYPNGRIVYQYLTMSGVLNSATIGMQNATKTDGLQVVFNAAYVANNLAIEFRPPAQFLSVTPESGSVPAGGFLDLTVGFNAAGLSGGNYFGQIHIAGNDPVTPTKDVPARLTVTGVPDIATNPTALAYGDVFVGFPLALQLDVQNIGTDVLNVTSITSDNARFTPSVANMSVGPLSTVQMTVTFDPNAVGAQSGTLTLVSNDPDTPSLAVAMSGNGVVAPGMVVTPDTIRAALATTLGSFALTTTKQVIIENNGGSDLSWTASGLTAAPQPIPGPAIDGAKEAAFSPGVPQIDAAGGPDAFGYRWIDSNEAGGPAFDWQDITAVGSPLALNGDDQNIGPIALPFPFSFYGNTFNSLRICSNGWVSFTSTLTSLTNTTLPNAGTAVPENLIAAFWDDLDFRPASGSGAAYSHYDGQKFILSFHNVPRFSSGGPYTFQILLWPNGTIDVQYLSMQGTRLAEATVGIQNATKDVGLQVVYNAAYVQDNLRVRFTRTPDWIAVAPTSGVLAAGERDTVTVSLDATDLADGDFAGVVRITSDAPGNPADDVPTLLHVGVAPAALDFNPSGITAGVSNVVEGIVTPPTGPGATHAPTNMLTSSIRIQRVFPHLSGEPVVYTPIDATYSFDRLHVFSLLPIGENVPVEVIGEVDGRTWFQAWDSVRVLRPAMTVTSGIATINSPDAGPVFSVGFPVYLEWKDQVGHPATSYEVWFSRDAGVSWVPLALGLTERDFTWNVTGPATQNARLEVAAYDAEGYMGSWISQTFTVHEGVLDTPDELPVAAGLRFASANPARGTARMELSLPTQSRVEVVIHDIRGAVVKRVADGTFEAGRHMIQWDGRLSSGAAAQPGVYFVRAKAAGRSFNVRFAMIR